MTGKIRSMVYSGDPEMVRLGITLAVQYLSLEDCQKIIPWNRYLHYRHWEEDSLIRSKYLYKDQKQPINFSTREHMKDFMVIKGNVAIAIYGGYVMCRSLGMMKVLYDFDKIEKVYF